jgi:hypothetical protein
MITLDLKDEGQNFNRKTGVDKGVPFARARWEGPARSNRLLKF